MAKKKKSIEGKTSREWQFYPSERDADKCVLRWRHMTLRCGQEIKWGVDRLPLVEPELRDGSGRRWRY